VWGSIRQVKERLLCYVKKGRLELWEERVIGGAYGHPQMEGGRGFQKKKVILKEMVECLSTAWGKGTGGGVLKLGTMVKSQVGDRKRLRQNEGNARREICQAQVEKECK